MNPKRNNPSLVERIFERGIIGMAILGGVAAIGLPMYDTFRDIYDGPVQGAKNVQVSPVWLPGDPGFNTAYYAGNTVEITYENGVRVSFRDLNGDFKVDPEDTVEGDRSQVNLEAVLGEAKTRTIAELEKRQERKQGFPSYF